MKIFIHQAFIFLLRVVAAWAIGRFLNRLFKG